MNDNSLHPGETISALLTDVDGTLVTKEKVLTERALAAVRQLRERGIVYTITSGRPPFGMRTLVEPLGLTMPMAAFNGGVIVLPDFPDEPSMADHRRWRAGIRRLRGRPDDILGFVDRLSRQQDLATDGCYADRRVLPLVGGPVREVEIADVWMQAPTTLF